MSDLLAKYERLSRGAAEREAERDDQPGSGLVVINRNGLDMLLAVVRAVEQERVAREAWNQFIDTTTVWSQPIYEEQNRIAAALRAAIAETAVALAALTDDQP